VFSGPCICADCCGLWRFSRFVSYGYKMLTNEVKWASGARPEWAVAHGAAPRPSSFWAQVSIGLGETRL
jgi:hypothetical protein